MLKKLIFICEGQTELFFCEKLLKRHFKDFNIDIECHIISHSNGGIVKWVNLKKQIEETLLFESPSFVTTFIDFYGIETYHEFPNWSVLNSGKNIIENIELIEAEMKNDIDNKTNSNFIPYIQLHEFESLVFSDYLQFENYYLHREANFIELKKITLNFLNPEEINNSIETAPSKRLKQNIKRYDKITHGVEICELISLEKIRLKCPRFNNWISKLENI